MIDNHLHAFGRLHRTSSSFKLTGSFVLTWYDATLRISACRFLTNTMTPLEIATDATGRSASTEANGNGAIYQTVWRLHFYAGLFVVPVVLLLAVTGAIYLFKPHLEPILYQDAWFTEVPQTSISPTSLSIDQQLRHAKAAYPEMRFSGIQRFSDPTRTTEFSARQNSQTTLVYLSPYSGAITGQIDRDQMLMRRVRNLHGELMLGTIGSAIVELAACWTVVLLTSGLYLWWPRGKSKWKGVFWPRRAAGKRIFWRDIHAVVAVYSSIIILTLIMTGLPWSNVWGGAFKRSLAATGQAQPAAASRRPKFQSTVSAATAIPVAKALEIAAEHGMTGDLSIKLPRGKKGAYSFAQRPLDLSQHRFCTWTNTPGRYCLRRLGPISRSGRQPKRSEFAYIRGSCLELQIS